jgi:hypothetical protein
MSSSADFFENYRKISKLSTCTITAFVLSASFRSAAFAYLASISNNHIYKRLKKINRFAAALTASNLAVRIRGIRPIRKHPRPPPSFGFSSFFRLASGSSPSGLIQQPLLRRQYRDLAQHFSDLPQRPLDIKGVFDVLA